MTAQTSHLDYYRDLEDEIAALKEFAEPLMEEVIVTPLMPLINRIMSLEGRLGGLEDSKILSIQREVDDCKRERADLSYEMVIQTITKPDPSKVFRILSNGNLFERALKKAKGKKIHLGDGKEIVVTPEVINALTRYRFSLGTPPVTPKGIRTVEEIVFGGSLKNIYAFRDLIDCDKGVFDRFLGSADRLTSQSTHYTTEAEKRDYKRKATEFCNLEGERGFSKAIVSGTSQTAIRMIREQLFSKHTNGRSPLKILDGVTDFGPDLIRKMNEDKDSVFVVRAKAIPHQVFTDDVLRPEWQGLIGRLIVIDETENAKRSGTTLVYSLIPKITSYLEQFHVKDSGTPANTQMNLRLILENFKERDIDELVRSVDEKITKLEAEGASHLSPDQVRHREWQKTSQIDTINLKKFKRFLEFIRKMKSSSLEDLSDQNEAMSKKAADLTMRYFFKNLIGKGYQCVSVPQGGGRREIGLPGRFHLLGHKERVKAFKTEKLTAAKERLAALKRELGIPEGTTAAEFAALQRALQGRKSPSAVPEEQPGSRLQAQIRSGVREAAHDVLSRSETGIEGIIARLDEILAIPLPGLLKSKVARFLRRGGIEAGAKVLERGGFREAANRLRAAEGLIRRTVVGAAQQLQAPLEALRNRLEPSDLDLIQKLLNDIESDAFEPSLALPEVSWTVEDVLPEEDYPKKNFLKLDLNADGSIDPLSLERKLEEKRRALADFPELFELYCSSIIIYFNDPHNPTSQVASPSVKLKLLDIASKYEIAILADEPYHKQVSKAVKDVQGDEPFAEFYERNRPRFANPVRIYSSISTTKWAMGAGRRTGILLSNDTTRTVDGKTFEDFVRENTDGYNSMSLYMDIETLETGLLVKKVCKVLEENILDIDPKSFFDPYGTSVRVLDEIFAEHFSDLHAEVFNPCLYSLLLTARNDIDKLHVRGATVLDYRQYFSELVSRLKMFRLDKQTQKDSAERAKAANEAVARLSQEFPGLKERCIEPQGPFYFLVGLEEDGKDPDLQLFLEALAAARNIGVVPIAKGYVRFAFGGEVDGSPEGYKLLSLAIETDLRLLLQYWKVFQETRLRFAREGNPNASYAALKELFPGGEVDLAQTILDKQILLDALRGRNLQSGERLTNRFTAEGSQWLSSIEPNSPATLVTIRGAACQTVEDFMKSKPFRELFNIYLLQVKDRIAGLEQMEDAEIIAQYGSEEFAKRFKSRSFINVRKDIFQEIAIEVANLWFSPSTIKTLGLEFPTGIDSSVQADAINGAEKRIFNFIQSFLQAFVTEEREFGQAGVVKKSLEEYPLQSAIRYKPAFQAGYPRLTGLKADSSLPPWLQKLVERAEYAGQSIATDRSPTMVTPGAARVAGYERGIYRRDTEGGPGADYFRKRLGELAEIMNPKDYICKMVQVGPTRIMLVMHRSYSHYLAEDLRLFPQTEISFEEMKNLKPDSVSFLGIPTKTIGEDYRIGYFLDEDTEGNGIPVSWVDAEDITDYMGYFKKPLLTMGNERVKAIGGLPIHGSALTITAKNGLRKTVVMAGDSGTGKSETIIAMSQQIMEGLGGAQNIESVELLSGDMLSLYEGDDGQMYMMGTESGDFMRLTDIPKDWQVRMRDWIDTASKTNPDHPTNPRATINGICNAREFLSPVRVNMFFNLNNFESPSGPPVQQELDPENLILDAYVKGYRREKGTSGDQPNLYASVLHSKAPDKSDVLTKHQENLDRLLGWDLVLGENGKVKTSILSFNDVPGEVFKAKRIVKDLFLGRRFKFKDGTDEMFITEVNYKVRENRFTAVVKNEATGVREERPLDRGIFDQIYNPIASTYCGNPFVDPRGMDSVLKRFAGVLKRAKVITGTIYTELAVKDQEMLGPGRAAQGLIDFIETDPEINDRFQRNKRRVSGALLAKYGSKILGQTSIPQEVEAFNLYLLERQESDHVHLVDARAKTIPLKTPYFVNKKRSESTKFEPSLIHPDVQEAIEHVCSSRDAQTINLETFTNPPLVPYDEIQKWNSKEELIYQILLINGVMRLNYPSGVIHQHVPEVKKAEVIAEKIIAQRQAA